MVRVVQRVTKTRREGMMMGMAQRVTRIERKKRIIEGWDSYEWWEWYKGWQKQEAREGWWRWNKWWQWQKGRQGWKKGEIAMDGDSGRRMTKKEKEGWWEWYKDDKNRKRGKDGTKGDKERKGEKDEIRVGKLRMVRKVQKMTKTGREGKMGEGVVKRLTEGQKRRQEWQTGEVARKGEKAMTVKGVQRWARIWTSMLSNEVDVKHRRLLKTGFFTVLS
jgi:hypothetical protein